MAMKASKVSELEGIPKSSEVIPLLFVVPYIIDETYWVLLKMISFARSISNFARTILHWSRSLFLKTTNVLAIFPKKLAVAVLCAASIVLHIARGVLTTCKA